MPTCPLAGLHNFFGEHLAVPPTTRPVGLGTTVVWVTGDSGLGSIPAPDLSPGAEFSQVGSEAVVSAWFCYRMLARNPPHYFNIKGLEQRVHAVRDWTCMVLWLVSLPEPGVEVILWLYCRTRV